MEVLKETNNFIEKTKSSKAYYLPTYMKKMNIVVYEKNFFLSERYLEIMFEIFKSSSFYTEKEQLINHNNLLKPQLLMIDIDETNEIWNLNK